MDHKPGIACDCSQCSTVTITTRDVFVSIYEMINTNVLAIDQTEKLPPNLIPVKTMSFASTAYF